MLRSSRRAEPSDMGAGRGPTLLTLPAMPSNTCCCTDVVGSWHRLSADELMAARWLSAETQPWTRCCRSIPEAADPPAERGRSQLHLQGRGKGSPCRLSKLGRGAAGRGAPSCRPGIIMALLRRDRRRRRGCLPWGRPLLSSWACLRPPCHQVPYMVLCRRRHRGRRRRKNLSAPLSTTLSA